VDAESVDRGLCFLLLGFDLLVVFFGAAFGRGVTECLPPVPAFAPDFGHVGPVTADRLSTLATDLRHVLSIFADSGAAFATNSCHMSAIAADGFAALASNARHMEPISTDGLTTLASRFSGLLRRKLVSSTFDVGSLTPLARDCALSIRRHRGKTAPRTFSHDASYFPVPEREWEQVPS
jgi:hypothetical protein